MMVISLNLSSATKLLVALGLAAPLLAQTQPNQPKPEPDVLIFNNGEKLLGTLEGSTGSSVVFKSDMAGEITTDWSKIKELHSSRAFKAIPTNVKVSKADLTTLPQGKVDVSNNTIQLTKPNEPAPYTVPVAEAAFLVNQELIDRAVLHPPGLFSDWKGAVTAGTTLVLSTQNSRTYTGAFNLTRSEPTENWLDPKSRTTVDFSAAYGKLSQPNTPTVKTEIIHGDAERDRYFSPRIYIFGQGTWDHNFSQGLDLAQNYGIGAGASVIKRPQEELDFRASVAYIRQQFESSASDQELVGSTFAENYNRKLPRNITLVESLAVTPSWNNLNAYSAVGNITLALPVYKRFNVILSTIDNFLNDPPPGFKKNSFQFVSGLTYTLP